MTDLEKALAEGLRLIRLNHQGVKTDHDPDDISDYGFSMACVECGGYWPCSTFKTADDALKKVRRAD